MKRFSLTFTLALLSFVCVAMASPFNTGVIAIQVENCSLEEYEKILDLFEENEFQVDYACNISGIFIFKAQKTAIDNPADLKHQVFKKVSTIVGKNRITVLKTFLENNTQSTGC